MLLYFYEVKMFSPNSRLPAKAFNLSYIRCYFRKNWKEWGILQCMDAVLVKLVLLCSISYKKVICKACYSSVTFMLPPKCCMFNENGNPNTCESLFAAQLLLDTRASTQKYAFKLFLTEEAQWELALLDNR